MFITRSNVIQKTAIYFHFIITLINTHQLTSLEYYLGLRSTVLSEMHQAKAVSSDGRKTAYQLSSKKVNAVKGFSIKKSDKSSPEYKPMLFWMVAEETNIQFERSGGTNSGRF